MTSKYYIVEFSDGMQLVPYSWLSKDRTKCYFPREYSSLKYNKAVKRQEKPDKSWPVFDILRVLGHANSYEVGRKRLLKAEMTSDLETTDFEENTSMQRIPVNEEEVDVFPDEVETPLPQCSSGMSFAGINCSTPSRQPTDIPNLSSPKEAISLHSLHYMMRKIYLSVEEIKETLNHLSIEKNVEDKFNIEFKTKFPMKNLDDIIELESIIKEEENRKYLVKKLRMIGGKGVKNIVVKQLQYLMTSELATKFSYYGTKDKKAFSVLSLHNVIIDVTNQQAGLATETDVKEAIQNWLRHAKDRLRHTGKEL